MGMMNFSFVTQGPYSKNVGGRTYLMEDDDNYKMFKLLDQEFTFTVNAGGLPCGLNGAVYFVSMDADGGASFDAELWAGATHVVGLSHVPPFVGHEAEHDGWARTLSKGCTTSQWALSAGVSSSHSPLGWFSSEIMNFARAAGPQTYDDFSFAFLISPGT